MDALTYADIHHLRAAEGWLELGNHGEADAELGHIPEHQVRPEVLRVRWAIHSAAKNWPLAAEIAETLTQLTPEDPRSWLHQSFALHELKRTLEARDKLAAVADKFPDYAVIPYNLACYECQLGNLAKARDLLGQAFRLPGGTELKAGAVSDLDLEPLWQQLKE